MTAPEPFTLGKAVAAVGLHPIHWSGKVHRIPAKVRGPNSERAHAIIEFELRAGLHQWAYVDRLPGEPQKFLEAFDRVAQRAVRRRVVMELGATGRTQSQFREALVLLEAFQMMRDEGLELWLRELAARALGALGETSPLADLVAFGIEHSADSAAEAVERIQPGCGCVLRHALGTEDADADDKAVLEGLRDPTTRSAYAEAVAGYLETDDRTLRRQAAEWLTDYGDENQIRRLEPHAATALFTDHKLRRLSTQAIEAIRNRTPEGNLSLAEAREEAGRLSEDARGALAPTESGR